jgi:hypothetical protein
MELSAAGANVKMRSPWAPIGLGLITLGIYNVVWYYKINREMRDFGRARGDHDLAESNPAMSVLAVTLGAILIIPAIVSFFKTVGRVQRVERLQGSEPISMGLVIVLTIFGLSVVVTYLLQQRLNGVWQRYMPPQALGHAPAVGAPVSAGERV